MTDDIADDIVLFIINARGSFGIYHFKCSSSESRMDSDWLSVFIVYQLGEKSFWKGFQQHFV